MKRKLKINNPRPSEWLKGDLETYTVALAFAIVYGSPKQLSNAIIYNRIGDKCDDCNLRYYDCKCEGSMEEPGDTCEECWQNYCLCGFDIFDKKGNVVPEKIRKIAWNIAKKTIKDDYQFYVLVNLINTQLDSELIYGKKRLLNESNFLTKLNILYEHINSSTKIRDFEKAIVKIFRKFPSAR